MKKMFRRLTAMTMTIAMLLSLGMTALATDEISYEEKYELVSNTIGNFTLDIVHKGEIVHVSIDMNSMTNDRIEKIYDAIIEMGSTSYMENLVSELQESFGSGANSDIALATETTSSYVYLDTQNGDNNSGIETVNVRQSTYAEFNQNYAEEYYLLMTLAVYVNNGLISDVKCRYADAENLRHATFHLKPTDDSAYVRSDGLTASYNIHYTLRRSVSINDYLPDMTLEKDMSAGVIIYARPN